MELPTGKKPGGRPRTRKFKAGDRVPLSLRVTPELKDWIDGASKASGRSQSQEVEFRLARSMEREMLLVDALMLRHGVKGSAVMMMLSRAFRIVERLAAHYTLLEGRHWLIEQWLDDPRCYEAVAAAMTAVLNDLHPSRHSLTVHQKPSFKSGDWEGLGKFAAHVALMGMFDRDEDGRTLAERMPGNRAVSASAERPKKGYDNPPGEVRDEAVAYWIPRVREAEDDLDKANKKAKAEGDKLRELLKSAPPEVRKKFAEHMKGRRG